MEEFLTELHTNTNSHKVLYIAIGCAQGFYPEGKHSAQQYPPFLQEWNQPPNAEQFILLIDPLLEDPPRSVVDAVLTLDSEWLGRIHFFQKQTHFHWYDESCRVFIRKLFDFILDNSNTGSVYLIVQDYSGYELKQEFLTFLGGFSPESAAILRKRVLFDPSYDGPSCFPDLSIPLLRDDETGDFLDPQITSLQQLRISHSHQSILKKQSEFRSALIRYYAGRLYREELTTPSSSIYAFERLKFFEPIVGYTITSDTLRQLIIDTLIDFGYTDDKQQWSIEDLLSSGPTLTQQFSLLCRECN